MKTQILTGEGQHQIVLTAENETDQSVVAILNNVTKSGRFRFYVSSNPFTIEECRGGYYRGYSQFSDSNYTGDRSFTNKAAILVIENEKAQEVKTS